MDNGLKRIIKLTENQFKTLLNERLSSVLYHFTNLYNTYEMLKDNAFYLNTSYRGGSDDWHKTKKFYMCFTRQASGKQGYSRGKSVRIEFDGDLLNQRFEGKPIDYWGNTMGKQQFFRDPKYGGGNVINYEQNTTESEDRLFSSEPVIRDIIKYIKRIDILLDTKKQFNTLSIDVFSNLDSLKYAYAIQNLMLDKVNVYISEKDFNLRNDKVINDWLSNQYELYGINKNNIRNNAAYQLFNILQFINYAEGVDLYNDKKRKEAIGEVAKLLKHYHLEKFLPKIMSYYKSYSDREFKGKDISLTNILNDLRNYNKEDYVLIAKMLDDYLSSHGYKNQRDVINKKEEKWMKERYGQDYDNFIEIFAFKPNGQSDKYGNIIIPNPDKTSFWSLFDSDYKKYFIEDVYRNIRQHGSKDDTSFYKFLQHLTKNNISVTKMLSILNKLGFDEDFDIIDYIFGGKFTNIKINYYSFENQKYLNDNDKEQVKNMFMA